jgi:hypothetical protein
MNKSPNYEIIKEIETNISLIKVDDDIMPYQIIISIPKQDDMVCDPPEPYLIPSNEKGIESIELARRIRIGILKKVYPDDWEVRHVTPQDRFANNDPIKENAAGYHYVRYKSPHKSQKFPSFEARVFNPETSRMSVLANLTFGQPYQGESIESAFVKACVAVDGYYGLPEKSFRTYLKYLKKERVNYKEFEEKISELKKLTQESARKEYLRKYLVTSEKKIIQKDKKPIKNLFMKNPEEDFSKLKGHYPYIYINKKKDNWTFSAVVPTYDDNTACTLGTFVVDEKNYKNTWKQLAKLVDGHFKRTINSDGHYSSIAPPSFEVLTSE